MVDQLVPVEDSDDVVHDDTQGGQQGNPHADSAADADVSSIQSSSDVDHDQTTGGTSGNPHADSAASADVSSIQSSSDVDHDQTTGGGATDAHHAKTSQASELSDVSADSTADAHHARYTDSEAESAVSPLITIGETFRLTHAIHIRSFGVGGQDDFPVGAVWNNSGSKLYVVGSGNNNVYEYAATTPFDISTTTFSQSFDVSNQTQNPIGIAWNRDGSKMYISSANPDNNVYEYTLSAEFDISTASSNQSTDVGTNSDDPKDMAWNNDGSKLYIVDNTNSDINEYTLSTDYDISTISFNQSLSVGSEDGDATGVAWSNDGTKLFMVGRDSDSIYEYDTPTAFDISTSSLVQSYDISNQDDLPQAVFLSEYGSKFFVVGRGNDSVYEYATRQAVSPP